MLDFFCHEKFLKSLSHQICCFFRGSKRCQHMGCQHMWRCTVFHINFLKIIQIVQTRSGRFLYVAFRPLPLKFFVLHFDVVCSDGVGVRLSFSNLFKTAKATATHLQFPFLVPPSKNTVEEISGFKGSTGKTAKNTPWERIQNYVAIFYIKYRTQVFFYHYTLWKELRNLVKL